MQVPIGTLQGEVTKKAIRPYFKQKPRKHAAFRGFKEAVYLDLDNRYKK